MKLAINHQIMDVDVSADVTVLEFLRSRGLTGTKEGCASGDCGACTVMVRRQGAGTTHSESINACIAPVGQFSGCHLLTVEGLAKNGELHPAQRQMVDCHGSQCGFCTPGFVMSLATMVESDAPADRETVLEGISGNLCRCTGYKPIVSAGMKALECEASVDDVSVLSSLKETAGGSAVIQPASEQALRRALIDYPDAPLIAGGTDLFLEVTQRYEKIPVLIDVCQVVGMNEIEIDDSAVTIGAAVPYTGLETLLAERSPPLKQLLLRLGSRQIRNRGTVGGNLANGSPIADMPPALIAWDAVLELVDANGERRDVKVEDFYLGYRDTVLDKREYIARITVPSGSFDTFHRFYKSSKRLEDDISSTMGAFMFDGSDQVIESARIAYGGMAATPVRLNRVEDLLKGRLIDEALITEAANMLSEEMTPLTDVRASAAYRMAIAQSMLTRALQEYCGDTAPLITEVALDA